MTTAQKSLGCADKNTAKDEGIEKLEEFILNEKLQVDEKIFYYCAGIATMATLKLLMK